MRANDSDCRDCGGPSGRRKRNAKPDCPRPDGRRWRSIHDVESRIIERGDRGLDCPDCRIGGRPGRRRRSVQEEIEVADRRGHGGGGGGRWICHYEEDRSSRCEGRGCGNQGGGRRRRSVQEDGTRIVEENERGLDCPDCGGGRPGRRRRSVQKEIEVAERRGPGGGGGGGGRRICHYEEDRSSSCEGRGCDNQGGGRRK